MVDVLATTPPPLPALAPVTTELDGCHRTGIEGLGLGATEDGPLDY